MVPSTLRIWMYTFPLGKAALATRAVSSGMGPIGCGCIDMAVFSKGAGFRDYILEYAASLMNKPTVSFRDTTVEGPGQYTMLGVNFRGFRQCRIEAEGPLEGASRLASSYAARCRCR